jgi:hypothetical protein
MAHEYLLWVVVIGCALHIMEESLLDFVGVMARVTGRFSLPLTLSWPDFYIANAAMIVGAISGAMIGWRAPEISLMIPALTVINALTFHVTGSILTRRFLPGTLTAVLVYLPVAAWVYDGASRDGVLTSQVLIISSLGGALLMAFLPLCLVLKKRLAGMG